MENKLSKLQKKRKGHFIFENQITPQLAQAFPDEFMKLY